MDVLLYSMCMYEFLMYVLDVLTLLMHGRYLNMFLMHMDEFMLFTLSWMMCTCMISWLQCRIDRWMFVLLFVFVCMYLYEHYAM